MDEEGRIKSYQLISYCIALRNLGFKL